MHRYLAAEGKRPFNLSQDVMLTAVSWLERARVHTLGDDAPHCVGRVVDGLFFRELTSLYKAFSTGQPSPLPELPLQYADYAAWQGSS